MHYASLHSVDLTKALLKLGDCYMLPGKIQNDLVGIEFSIYTQWNGRNVPISVETVLSSFHNSAFCNFLRVEIVIFPNKENCRQPGGSN